jgi:1-acyl-sn-glycerol-3-phosphate acyltransferase
VKNILSNLYKLYAYTVFILTLFVFYPITALLVISPKTRKWSTAVFLVWSYLLSLLFLIFVSKQGAKPDKNPKIIIANHTSYLDIFLMYQILPMQHIVFMGKSEILNYPLIKTYFKYLHIPVNRSDKRQAAQSILMAKSKLQEGWSIVIFPEGGIPDYIAPEMADFKPGAFVMAQKNQVSILPMSLQTHYKLLSEPQNMKGSARPGLAKVFIHPEISIDELNTKEIEYWMEKTRDLISSKLHGE